MDQLKNMMNVCFIIFECVFTYYMLKLNKHLSQFFRIVSVKSYPMKAMAMLLIMYWVISVND